jgi:DNA-binding helix-hairpin-helix protein with protein kinase domain
MSISANAQLWAHDSARPHRFSSWQPIILGEQLNAGAYGGTSSIHRIANPAMSHLVAKIFNEAALPRRRTQAAHDKLDFIARHSQRLRDGYTAGAPRVAGRPHVAWPEMPLYVEQRAAPDKLAGFVMPAFHGMHPLQLFYTPKHRRSHFPTATADTLLATAAGLAGMIDQLHGGAGDSGILIADLTPRNILINARYELRLIDADSFQYSVRGVVHGTNESTPGFRSPNMARAARAGTNLPRFTKTDDAYALTIALFHMLVDGAHPWRAGSRFEINGVAPDEEDNMLARRFPFAAPDQFHPPRIRLQTYQRLSAEVRAAFERAFLAEAPPTPAQWVDILGRARVGSYAPAYGFSFPPAA